MSLFPEVSVNRYITVVVPTGKDVPGACDLLRVGATPESSVAVGSIQKAKAKLLPAGAATLISLRGQSIMTGAESSSPWTDPYQ